MTPDSLPTSPSDPVAGPSGLARVLGWWPSLVLPLLTAVGVTAFEWAEPVGSGAAWHVALGVGLVMAVQALWIEWGLLRPWRQWAARLDAQVAAAAPVAPAGATEAGSAAGPVAALRRACRALAHQHDELRRLRAQVADQHRLLDQARATIETQQRELASLVRTDALTGLANQRAFDEALRREFKRAQRQRGLLAVAVLDLDDFKLFNQQHGTAVGDLALQRVAALLNERFKRDTDVVARLGGEEFVALLPGVGMAEAQGVLELLRDDLRELRLPDGQGSLTLSIGLAAASPAHPYLSAQALLQAADEALYIAKHAGRDRLSLAA